MISPASLDQMSPVGAACFGVGAEPLITARLQQVADCEGTQLGCEIWKLRVAVGNIPAGECVARRQLVRALGLSYGSAVLPKAEDFNHVEGAR